MTLHTPASEQTRNLMVVFALAAVFLAALDQTVVATALPVIAQGFGSLDTMPWVVASYLMAATLAIPVTGRLIDRYGARRVFGLSLVLFLVGSLGCGIAPNASLLVIARAVQGCGGGAVGTAALTMVSELAGRERLGRYQSYFGLLFGVASIVGPVLGGVITTAVGWRWIFHLNVVVGVVILALARVPKATPQRQGPAVNYVNLTVLAGALCALVAVSIWGPTADRSTLLVWVTLGVVFVALFLVVERRSSTPLVATEVLRLPAVSVASLVGFLAAMGLFTVITYLPAMFQMAAAKSPAGAGVLMIPFMVAVMVSSLWAGREVDRRGHPWRFIASGTGLAGGILVVITLIGPRASETVIMGCGLVFGLGIGMVMQMIILSAQRAAAPQVVGSATATVVFLRSVGSLLGVAVLGGLFTALVSRGLDGTGARISVSDTADPAALRALPPEVRSHVIDLVGHSYQVIFGIGSAILLAASAIAWVRVRQTRGPEGSGAETVAR